MYVNKSYKFRMYPSKEQIISIRKNIGCASLVFNKLLEAKFNNPKLSKFDLNRLIPSLKEQYEFLKEVEPSSLQNCATDIINGYNRYLSGKGEKPNFKKKGVKTSYRINAVYSSYKDNNYCNIMIDLKERTIKLPRLGKVSIRGYRNSKSFNAKIYNVTIRKEAGRYYVSVCVKENIEVKGTSTNKIVGIDIGIKNVVVTSDNKTYGNINALSKREERIKKLQVQLSRKVKGSNNYNKLKLKIEREYQKLRNGRKHMIDDIVSNLTKEDDVIIAETLKVNEMIKNGSKSIKRGILDVTFSSILVKLKYKCVWLGKKFYQINAYFPSSQKCSKCGYIDKGMKDLRIREYHCKKCGNTLDRDYNASINILKEGIRVYSL